VLRFLGMRPWFERAVLISDAARQFDGDGRLTDAATRQRIRTFVEGFGAFVAQHGPHTALATPNPQVDAHRQGAIASGHRERAVMTS
jgi:hypothetical protein